MPSCSVARRSDYATTNIYINLRDGDKLMGTNAEQWQSQWSAEIARLAARIAELKAQADAEYQDLHISLDTQIAALQDDLRKLEAAVAAGPDAYARKIETQIAELNAKGDAAYDALRAAMLGHLDPTAAEIKRLEAAAAATDGEAKARLTARIAELKVRHQTGDHEYQQSGDTPASP